MASVRTKLEEVLRKRFFYAPAFSIYGGVAGLYDYGPPGCALQANILALWRSHFVLEEQMLEVDATIMTPHAVLKTSGHVDRFTDYMVKDTVTGDVFRADHLLESALEKAVEDEKTNGELKKEAKHALAQIDGLNGEDLQRLLSKFAVTSDSGNALGPVTKFNLMFGTEIGPTGALAGFLRPETAQGQFVNFRRLLEANNERMPFASAMIGKSFRNEISPRSGLIRVREFTMAEIEHYVDPMKKDHVRFAEVSDFRLNLLSANIQQAGQTDTIKMSIGEAVAKGVVNNQTLGYFLARTAMFLLRIGVKEERIRFRQHMSNEMAHYASDCWDAEIYSSYGWIECVGCADRHCYDLTQHSKATGEKLVARERLPEPITQKRKRIEVDKRALGVAFRAQAQSIIAKLESLPDNEVETLMASTVDGMIKLNLDGKDLALAPAMARLVETNETIHVREYTPAVIEPSFGIGRIMYSLLEHVYYQRPDDEQRSVLAFPASVAPNKVLVAPLSGNSEFRPFVTDLVKRLRARDVACVVDDSSTSIGRRYARHDEVGTPFAATVDFQTTVDSTVTLRERDSTAQVRLPINELAGAVWELCLGGLSWTQVVEKYGLFTEQSINLDIEDRN